MNVYAKIAGIDGIYQKQNILISLIAIIATRIT